MYDVIFEDSSMSFYDAYKEEQRFLKEHSKNRIIINQHGFKTTEAFDINVIR
jgi:hypothetical protein